MDFNVKLVPRRGLALLTARGTEEGPLCIADFRDTLALVYKPTGDFVGFSLGRGMRLGRRPLRMVGGVWEMDEVDERKGHEDVVLAPDLLELEPIEPSATF